MSVQPRTTLVGAAAGALLLLLVGCQGLTTPSPVEAAAKPLPRRGLALFEVIDPMARNSLSCTGLIERKTPDGRIELTCNIKSRESFPQVLQVQCSWAAESSDLPAEQSAWREFSLAEHGTESLRFTAPREGLRLLSIRARLAR